MTRGWLRHLDMFQLLRQRNFGLLWFAGLISVAGDGALMTALPLHVYQVTGSALAAGGSFLAGMIPRVLFGSIAGVFVDRWNRQRTMIGADLLLAVLLLPLLAANSADAIWIVLLVRAAMAVGAVFFGPAENALLPLLVPSNDLIAANAMNSLNNTLGRLIGPAMGGFMFAAGGLGGVVVFDGVTFLVAAGLIALIRPPAGTAKAEPSDHPERGAKRIWREWSGGLQVVRGNPGLRIIFLAFGVGLLADGSFAAGFPALMLDVMLGGPQAVGLLLSAQSVGGLVGAVTVTAMAARFRPWVLFGGGLIGAGIADFTLGNSARIAAPGTPALVVGGIALLFAGFPLVAMNAASNGLIQTITPDEYRGRVFGALGTISALSMMMGTLAAGALIDQLGVEFVFSAGALLWVAGGAIALTGFGRQERKGGRSTPLPGPESPLAGAVDAVERRPPAGEPSG